MNQLELLRELANPRMPLERKRVRFLGRSLKLRSMFRTGAPARPIDADETDRLIFAADPDRIVEDIRTASYSPTVSLSPDALREIDAFCRGREFHIGYDKAAPVLFEDVPALTNAHLVGLMNPHADSPAIDAIANDRRLLTVAAKYFGTTPNIHSTHIWFNLPSDPPPPPSYHGFHYDIDDLHMLKVFFYLSDVDDEAGPHVIVSGTHAEGSMFKFLNRRISQDEALGRYRDRIVTMTGAAGTGFFEDTFAYHRGTAPKKPRLILQVEYSA